MASLENKDRGWKSILGMHILFLGLGILFLFIYSWLDISCLLRFITGVPCPTCGATRAMFSLARLDFVGYWFYNPMAFPLVIAFLAVFHFKLLPKWRKFIIVYVVIVLVLTVVFYVYRLMNGLIP